MKMDNYYLADNVGGKYSANPGDYWYMLDGEGWPDLTLIKKQHPWLTATGRFVFASRVLKRGPTINDLRRLAKTVWANE